MLGFGIGRKLTVAAGAAIFSLGLAGTAQANAVLTFDQGADAGTVSWDGSGALVGSGITFDILVVTGTGGTDRSYDCVGCQLNFTSGDLVDGSAPSLSWGGGGSFTITGSIFDSLVTMSTVAMGTLVSGTFVANSDGEAVFATFGAGGQLNITGFGIDEKHPDLLDFLNITSPDFVFSNTTISSNCAATGAGFDCNVTEADVSNTNVPGEVPEPASMLLLGTGLVGLAGAARRRMGRK